MVGGFIGVAVGSIGIVLPGLPTTGPFIFAAWCFSKSSPRFEQWILDLPGVGPMVLSYRAGLGMPRRAKIMALVMMWLAIGISAGVVLDLVWLRGVIVVLGLIGTWWILVRTPTSSPMNA